MKNPSTSEAKIPAPRERLIEVAIGLLEAGGPDAVQARKLASEIGMSTMAVYTHFGGMPDLFVAMVGEGFARLATHVRAVPESDDAMADFYAKGLAYRDWALRHPQLYRLMFGVTGTMTRRIERDMTVSGTISALPEGQASFEVMVSALDRAMHAGQIGPVDPVFAAGQFLSATHGFVLLEMAGYFGTEGNGFSPVLVPLGLSIMVGLGASHEEAVEAGTKALALFGVT